jgi:hypothetical protein
MDLHKVLSEPERPEGLVKDLYWLSGEGGGSWFEIKKVKEGKFLVFRYNPFGKIECNGEFVCYYDIDLSKKFEITYPSHCGKITLLQQGKRMTLNRIQ